MNGTSKRIRIKVFCSTCHTYLSTTAKPYDRNLPCPECGGNVHIPPYDPIEAEFRRRLNEPRNIDPGTYAVATGAEAPGEPKTPPPDIVKVVCPICRCVMHPEVRDEAWCETCPDCLELVRVPARDEIPEKFVPLPIPDPGQYEMGGESERDTIGSEVFRRLADVKERPQDPPPKWTFFSSVYSYPWSRYVWPRWAWMSVGFTLVWLLGMLCWSFLSAGGPIGLVAAFFALPLFWIFYLTASYCASCSLTILEDTANGTQVIDEWPDPVFREWMAALLYFAFLGTIAQAAGVLAEAVLGSNLHVWMISVGMMYAIYPIIVLSSLEAGSVFVPLTRVVLDSVFRYVHYWSVYYLVSAGITAGVVATAYFGLRSFPFASALWMGPLVAAFAIIQARLLGRLAWRTIVEPDGGRRRVRRARRIQKMMADREAERAAAQATRKAGRQK